MADRKISALTGATTPLAGTEVLPIVQSSTTVKVSVANLTAGRAVSTGALSVVAADATLDNAYSLKGKLVAGTAVGMMRRNSSDQVAIDEDGYGTVIGFSGSQLQISSGNATLQNGNFVPSTAAKGVNFTANTSAAGMTSQLLNWYEEGTWTPTSFDITYAAATGSYTRIGRQVFAHFSITLPTTSDANNITIVGLPFTVANTDQMRTGAIGYTDYGTACTLAPVKNTTRGNIFKFDGVPVTNANASGKVFAGVFIYNV